MATANNKKTNLSNVLANSLAQIPNNQSFLLAVSGGIDSMVLLDLFVKFKLKFQVAHANFNLRTLESNQDEQFVAKTCKSVRIPYHTKSFDVSLHQNNHNFSTQMAARDLRYKWFRSLQQQFSLDWIVTAHHLDDSIETFLIQLLRGSGLNGLCGIPMQDNGIWRPLLNCKKQDILQYAKENVVRWREDSSNAQSKYLRNQLRLEVLPKLTELNPNFHLNFKNTIRRLQSNRDLIDVLMEEKFNQLFQPSAHDSWIVQVKDLKTLKPLSANLYHLFKVYGFVKPQELIKFLDSDSGAEINSKTHRLVKNRNELILSKIKQKSKQQEYWIHSAQTLQEPIALQLELTNCNENNANAVLDADEFEFPIKLRKKEIGDYFYPIGLNGKKKLSKFFKDEKLSLLQKENTWLLCNQQNQIMYVIGHRADQRFAKNAKTKHFLNITLCNS